MFLCVFVWRRQDWKIAFQAQPRPVLALQLGVGESWLAFALKQGEIPKHIAFIMDGNRRYARRREMEVGRGHALGFDRLREVRLCSSIFNC